MSDKNRPVETLRDGSIKAAIFENKSEKGKFHSVTFSRTYTDADGKPKDSNRFSGADLLKLSALAGRSYEAVNKHRSDKSYAVQQREAASKPRDPDKGVQR